MKPKAHATSHHQRPLQKTLLRREEEASRNDRGAADIICVKNNRSIVEITVRLKRLPPVFDRKPSASVAALRDAF